MKYIYIQNNNPNGAGACPTLNEDIINIEVNDSIYNDYCENPNKYIYQNDELIVNPNYDEIVKQIQIEEQKRLLEIQFREIDEKRIRAACEDSIKDETTGETWLEFYNKKILSLREQYKALEEES